MLVRDKTRAPHRTYRPGMTCRALLIVLLLTACNGSAQKPPEAPLELAKYEWRVLRKIEAARARLAQLDTPEARIVAARIAAEQHDFATARAEAKRALAAAEAKQRRAALMTLANVVVDDPGSSSDELRGVIATLRETLAAEGPYLRLSRALLRAGLRAGDRAAAWEGVNGYYHGGPVAESARILASWKGTDEERPAIARALAAVRMFPEAALVEPRGEVAAYAAALERIAKATNEHYRQIALGHRDRNELDQLLERELRALKTTREELAKRYGTYFITGQTGGEHDMHFAHIVDDRPMKIEQYGRTANVRFVALDGVVTNGYAQWLADDASGDGGWGTAREIFQVRPLYADGPLHDWSSLSQPLEENTLPNRLYRQYLERVAAETKTRDAFIARVEHDTFLHSIVFHEGRHAIDDASGKKYKTWELEYRAKLSQIALAPSPRQALSSVLDYQIGGDSPHGKANERLAGELVAWMKAHKAGTVLEDVEKLTDEQIREAVRSLDPLARTR
jgi:hypothetical protein